MGSNPTRSTNREVQNGNETQIIRAIIMKTCDNCGKEVAMSDTDGLYYHVDDLEWEVRPGGEEWGVLGPKEGAIPLPDCFYALVNLRAPLTTFIGALYERLQS